MARNLKHGKLLVLGEFGDIDFNLFHLLFDHLARALSGLFDFGLVFFGLENLMKFLVGKVLFSHQLHHTPETFVSHANRAHKTTGMGDHLSLFGLHAFDLFLLFLFLVGVGRALVAHIRIVIG